MFHFYNRSVKFEQFLGSVPIKMVNPGLLPRVLDSKSGQCWRANVGDSGAFLLKYLYSSDDGSTIPAHFLGEQNTRWPLGRTITKKEIQKSKVHLIDTKQTLVYSFARRITIYISSRPQRLPIVIGTTCP